MSAHNERKEPKILRLGGWKQVSKQDSQRAANAAGGKPEVCDLDAKECC